MRFTLDHRLVYGLGDVTAVFMNSDIVLYKSMHPLGEDAVGNDRSAA